MKTIKTITIALPLEVGKTLQKIAKAEKKTISEFVQEAIRTYKAQQVFTSLAKKGRAIAKKKGLKPKDLYGHSDE